MYTNKEYLIEEISKIKAESTYKNETFFSSPQGAKIRLSNGKEVLNFCANNYLGLAGDPLIAKAAIDTISEYGYGVSSVRFICGTQDIHKRLETVISSFLQTEDTILYSSCFDANGGLFETLLSDEDAIISDELNHASIIDGIRLSKAERYRYKNADMSDLESILQKTQNKRFRLIVTDGVFSMEGTFAPLNTICDLAEKYNALVMVDDSHATGFIGNTGRGTIEHFNVFDRVDIITSTLGKALGGASGGFTSGRKEIIQYLRQKSRPYLFSNSLPPVIVGTALNVFERISLSSDLIDKLENNTKYFREKMHKAGFNIPKGVHPIVPIIIGDAKMASNMAEKMIGHGIFVVAFSYPVVPKGKARIRTQISAVHEQEHLDLAIESFIKVSKELKFI